MSAIVPTLMTLLAETSIRSMAVALAVAALLALCRARAGAVRHAAWTAVVASMLLMPLLTAALPPIGVTVPRSLSSLAPDLAAPPPVGPIVRASESAAAAATLASAPLATSLSPGDARAVNWWNVLAIVYGLAVAFGCARIAVGWRAAAGLARGARRIDVRADLLPRALSRRTMVKESAAIVVPVTVGVVAPVVLLPPAWRRWTDDERRAVLAHELAHVDRHDPLTTCMARINRSLFWFHPLAWWLERALTVHAEYAADEATLDSGIAPRQYADVLVALAQVVGANEGRLARSAIGMAGRNLLGRRIERVLHFGPASSAPRSQRVIVGLGCTVVILAGMACRLSSPPARFASSPAIERRDRDLRQQLARLEEEQRAGSGFDDPEGIGTRLTALWIQPDVEARRAAILRLIERHPESRLAGSVRARIFPVALEPSFPADPSGYQQAKSLWLRQASRADADPRVLANASFFLAGADGAIAEALVQRARRLDPEGPWVAHLGRLYAGALAPFLVFVTPRTARHLPPPDPGGAFASHVRELLATSSDDAVLTATGWFLARASSNQPQFFVDPRPWAEDCLKRAIQLNPRAVLAHSALLHVRSQLASQRQPLWRPPPVHQYELVAALHDEERFEQLPRLARRAYDTVRDLARWDDPNLRERSDLARIQARKYAEDTLRLAPKFRDRGDYGTAIYMANMTLSALALRAGDTHTAASYLLRAADAPPSEELVYSDDLAPDMHWHVVSDLLEKGERDAVATFLERLARVNIPSRLELQSAAAAVRRGGRVGL